MKYQELAQKLLSKNIRPSYQRLKILDYLLHNRCHPTADRIYGDLLPELPTLSRTTVYNTLDSFSEAELVRMVNIEDNQVRYDIDTSEHGHFKCGQCGKVFDFAIAAGELPNGGLEAFLVKEKNLYYKGLCPSCLKSAH